MSCVAHRQPEHCKKRRALGMAEGQLRSQRSCYSPHPGCATKCIRRAMSHLGSEILAECRTRPQYVPRSNWDTGRSRLPGNEDVMSTTVEGKKPRIEHAKLLVGVTGEICS